MHRTSIMRMQWFRDKFIPQRPQQPLRILDVGSMDIDGTYKHLFADTKRFEYTGMDIQDGPNVDMVINNPYIWREIPTATYDIIISGQTFEHSEYFWKTLEEMGRTLKKDGLLCIIAPEVAPESRSPIDCFRFLGDGMAALARYICFDTLHVSANAGIAPLAYSWFNTETPNNTSDAMLVARKPYDGLCRLPDYENYSCNPSDQNDLRSGLFSYDEHLIATHRIEIL